MARNNNKGKGQGAIARNMRVKKHLAWIKTTNQLRDLQLKSNQMKK